MGYRDHVIVLGIWLLEFVKSMDHSWEALRYPSEQLLVCVGRLLKGSSSGV